MSKHLPGARVSEDGWFWWDGTQWVRFESQRLDLAAAQRDHDEIRRGEIDDVAVTAEIPNTAGAVYMRDDDAGREYVAAKYRDYSAIPGPAAAWFLALLSVLVALVVLMLSPSTAIMWAMFGVTVAANSVAMFIDAAKIRESGAAGDDFARGTWLVNLAGATVAIPVYLYQRSRLVGAVSTVVVGTVAWAAALAIAYASIVGIPDVAKPSTGPVTNTEWDTFDDGSYAPPVGRN